MRIVFGLQLRGLGPGGVAPDSTLSSNFFDQTGDIKIEANLEYRWDRFYQQLAVGAGAGLLLDLEFVLLRFDVAIPLRQPSRPSGQSWVLDEIAFAKKSWRQDNISYNLVIGYPF